MVNKVKITKRIKNITEIFLQPFRSKDGFNSGLILIFILINSIVFLNAYLHDPLIGYDALSHIKYIKTLSQLQLVRPEDSAEFFSPPLPYAIPALLVTVTGMNVYLAAKLSQYLNFFLSLGTTWYLIKICHFINPRSALKIGALAFLGMLPVYYKTFAFVRGEPYVVFFSMVLVYYTLLIIFDEQYSITNGIILGLLMGFCALSRQWGFFLFPSIFLLFIYKWFKLPQRRKSIAKILCLCLVFITAISGWFYISLNQRYGSITAFNREVRPQIALNNQPWKFYLGVSPEVLFRNPVRPNFPNQFIPIFYSEIWGDYWGYFSIYGIDTRKPEFIDTYKIIDAFSEGYQPEWLVTNYETVGTYLGRVNTISIFPSLLIPISFIFTGIVVLSRRFNKEYSLRDKELFSFLFLTICSLCAGYLGFLIMYPNLAHGDNIKATYLIHAFPLIAIFIGVFLEYLHTKSKYIFRTILGGLGLIFLHNIFTIITHYRNYLLN